MKGSRLPQIRFTGRGEVRKEGGHMSVMLDILSRRRTYFYLFQWSAGGPRVGEGNWVDGRGAGGQDASRVTCWLGCLGGLASHRDVTQSSAQTKGIFTKGENQYFIT